MYKYTLLIFSTILIMLCTANSLRTNFLSPTLFETTKMQVFNREMFIKRDDINFHTSGLNGNKGRKLMNLLTSKNNLQHLVSYGGIQSNSLLALSKIAKSKQQKLWYISNSIPSNLKEDPIGNYKLALEAGTTFIEATPDQYRAVVQWSEHDENMEVHHPVLRSLLPTAPSENSQWIRQGGAVPAAKDGIDQLGCEVAEFIKTSFLPGPWQIIVACGTGTTAYFLANYFAAHPAFQEQKSVEVLAVPCVGSCTYLKKQMHVLDALSGGTGIYPTVLSTEKGPRRPFAKPNLEHLRIWQQLQSQSGIDFDLVYAPRTFELLLSQQDNCRDKSEISLERFRPESNLIYYHCGGTEGNESQLARYKATGLI